MNLVCVVCRLCIEVGSASCHNCTCDCHCPNFLDLSDAYTRAAKFKISCPVAALNGGRLVAAGPRTRGSSEL